MSKRIVLFSLLSIQFIEASVDSSYNVPWIWFAIFTIFVMVIAFFAYRYSVAKAQNKYDKILEKNTKLEDNKNKIISVVSKDMYNMTKDILSTDKLSESKNTESKNVENKLLNTTESLIEFLKLKSRKVKIGNDKFNINNVLNEVSGSLGSTFPNSDIELIFDVDNDIPRFLVGDSLHLGQILIGLLKSAIESGANGELRLEISRSKSMSMKQSLQFKVVDTDTGLTKDKLERLHTPYYDEEREVYVGLDLFVINELITLLDGELLTKHSEKEGTLFTLTLPMPASDWKERRKYRLPKKEMMNKKVLLVDSNNSSALAIKKMLSYFRYDVNIVSIEEFEKTKIDISIYDIIMLDEKLFRFHIISYIKSMKKTKNIKVLGISSIFLVDRIDVEEGVIDTRVSKPFSQEQIFEIIIDLFSSEKKQKIPEHSISKNSIKEDSSKSKYIVHKDPFEEKVNISSKSFSDFTKFNLLIVEDNIINQRILTSVLGQSNINISIANNGQEAVDMVMNSADKFDFVLMDINMPVMDGYVATAMIRADDRFADLPIVALTALILDSEISKMFQNGVNGYLAKPLKVGKLYSAFEFFMKKQDKDRGVVEAKIQQEEKPIVEDMYGLDIKQGIVYADGNIPLYREVLGEFLAAYGETDTVLRNFVDDQNYDQIRALSLDMRSLTKTIGAYKMNDVVDRLYKLFLYNNRHMVPKYAEEYGRELSSLRNSIKQYIDSPL